jgi:hypothetical protein
VTNCWAFFHPEMAEDNKIEATVSCPTHTDILPLQLA